MHRDIEKRLYEHCLQANALEGLMVYIGLYTIWQPCTLDQTCLSDLLKSSYLWELSYQQILLNFNRIVQ